MPSSLTSRTCSIVAMSAAVVLTTPNLAAAQNYGTGTTASPRTTSSPNYAAPAPARTTPSAAAAPAPAPAARQQSAAPASDSGLPDLLYIQPFVGGAYVHLKALDADNFDINSMDPNVQDVVVTSKGSGLRYGIAAGLNIIFIHVGGRLAFTQTSAFTLGTAMFEVALVPKLGPIEPSVRLGIGYAWQGDANYGNYQDQTDVYGLALGAGFGLDVRLGQVVGIGVALDADVLNMSRSTNVGDITTINAADGNAVGIQVALTGHLTLHI